MKRITWLICLLFNFFFASAQSVKARLTKAVATIMDDEQMKHAIMGISILKSNNAEVIFEMNPQIGLAPASCQKLITSATAMDLLGPQFRYQTILSYNGTIKEGILKGDIQLIGSGDPTLGSWRYSTTKEENLLQQWVESIKQKGITKIEGELTGFNGKWDSQTLPGGWIWDDIGNYYGAGSSALNWRENQYDLFLQSGTRVGDKVSIVETKPRLYGINLTSQLISANKGSGDKAYIYLPPTAQNGFIRGTIPVDETAFTISGSFPDPSFQLLATLNAQLVLENLKPDRFSVVTDKEMPIIQPISVIISPPLDSINYWFMKKSINLYGEALLKTMAYAKTGTGSTEKGVELVNKFWKERGIELSALHIIDGSGLSPQNRVTADALVKVLEYARGRSWFNYFYEALPVYNQMKLKSGTISGVKSFAGYHTSKNGTNYTVAIIINNYDGSGNEIVKKMFLVLDELK